MHITTSWMRQGIEQGIERKKTLILRQIKRKLEEINLSLETKIMELSIDDVEVLAEALFDFYTVEDLINWLNTLTAQFLGFFVILNPVIIKR